MQQIDGKKRKVKKRKWTKKSPKKTDPGISESWEVMGKDFEKQEAKEGGGGAERK